MDKHRESIGNTLLWSMVPAACVIVVITLMMIGDWEGVSWWHYPASWMNAVLGLYCWVALWLGIYLRSHRLWARILALVFLGLGMVLAILSACEELTN